MRADELMIRNVRKCAKSDSLEHAARLMWEADVGCLVVTDAEDRPIGMITDRDALMAAYTQGVRLRDATVESAMAHEVKTCSPESSLGDVERLMSGAQIRRVPVVEPDGRLAGILTLSDIARTSQSSPLGSSEIPGVAKTLASVTQLRQAAVALSEAIRPAE